MILQSNQLQQPNNQLMRIIQPIQDQIDQQQIAAPEQV
jgi:hypothetical protein